ncbi:hypothetical protein FSARC_14556, partial [Fusarium sarcochroum]
MNVSRVCRPCRTSKIKCDLARPKCGSCAKRGFACDGYTPENDFVFRNQNTVARNNSIRARRATSHEMSEAFSSDGVMDELSLAPGKWTAICQRAMPWLNERAIRSVPNPILHKLEDRARDIFYAEWITCSYDCGESPGHLELLPDMKARASQHSILGLAVDAFALANIHHFQVSSCDLRHVARARYGSALAAIRKAVASGTFSGDDSMLMGLLIIDMFETAFMPYQEPLGPHCTAIEHLLTARGTQQVFSVKGWSLYRMAHHRLQSRQLALCREPLPVQLACGVELNTTLPAVKVGLTLLQAQGTLYTSQELIKADLNSVSGYLERLLDNVRQIEYLLAELDYLSEKLAENWQPRYQTLAEQKQVPRIFETAQLPLIPHIRFYNDPWAAHKMNFLHHGQLVLRQMLLNILGVMMDLSNDAAIANQVLQQRRLINISASIITESIPPMLEAVTRDMYSQVTSGGSRINQYFACAACWTLEQSKHVSDESKEVAYRAR